MSSLKRGAAEKLRALRAAVAEEILLMTDEEVLDDARERGVNPDDVALSMRSKALEIITNSRKQKLKNAREALNAATINPNKYLKANIGLEEKKRRIQALFGTPDMRFSLAFRNGERQSDSDWESLWDDLVEQGLLSDEQPEG